MLFFLLCLLAHWMSNQRSNSVQKKHTFFQERFHLIKWNLWIEGNNYINTQTNIHILTWIERRSVFFFQQEYIRYCCFGNSFVWYVWVIYETKKTTEKSKQNTKTVEIIWANHDSDRPTEKSSTMSLSLDAITIILISERQTFKKTYRRLSLCVFFTLKIESKQKIETEKGNTAKKRINGK